MFQYLHYLGVTNVRTVFLERCTEEHDLRIPYLLSGKNELLYYLLTDVSGHVIVYLTACGYDPRMVSEPLGLIHEVIRIDTDTVSSDESRSESECIPLSVHRIDDLVRIDAHLVKCHRKLIDESYIDISL